MSAIVMRSRPAFVRPTDWICFRRYTRWDVANIDGFGEVVPPATVDALIAHRAPCVAYTHLGKQAADRPSCEDHVPQATRASLDHLAHRHAEGRVQLSGVADPLDYIVVRDRLALRDGRLEFHSADIRYPELAAADLVGKAFGLRGDATQIEAVVCGDRAVDFKLQEIEAGLLRLRLSPSAEVEP